MTLIVEHARPDVVAEAEALLTLFRAQSVPTTPVAPVAPAARGTIVALDAVDALAGLLARCAGVAADRPEIWGASVAELVVEEATQRAAVSR